jgi:hypothetical protein
MVSICIEWNDNADSAFPELKDIITETCEKTRWLGLFCSNGWDVRAMV